VSLLELNLPPLDKSPNPPHNDPDVEALFPEEEEGIGETGGPISSPFSQIAKITQILVYFKTCHLLCLF
jgi:hypothetical protein